jgi:hypothetical protein
MLATTWKAEQSFYNLFGFPHGIHRIERMLSSYRRALGSFSLWIVCLKKDPENWLNSEACCALLGASSPIDAASA